MDGRWTWPRASALLAVPGTGPRRTLTISGINHERRRVRFLVSIGGLRVLEPAPDPGPFTVTADVDAARHPPGPWLLRVERPDAFVPARLGLSDDRVLGVVLTSICVS